MERSLSGREQRRIALWLDGETAKVDELISHQEALIATLAERAKALVSRAVWLGIDGAACGTTGIDTAPLAPAHWRRARNKELIFETTEVSSTGEEEMLSVSHLTGITPRSEKNVTMFEAESVVGYRLVAPDDLVINTMWAWMGALGVSRYNGIVSPAYGVYRFRRKEELAPRYYDYLFRTNEYVVEMTRHSRGVWSSRLRLYPYAFLRLRTVMPPVEEQRRIVVHLDSQTARIDGLIAKATELIGIAKERRAALIAAAVTGQIDVNERLRAKGVA
jgi:type I restriction enzyme S subunit